MVFKTYQKVSLAKNKMANHKIDMLQIKQLLRLHSNGESKLSISNRLGLSRNTVRKYIGLFHAYQLTFDELSDLSIEEVEDLFETRELLPDSRESVAKNFFPYVSKELKKTGVTRYLLWQEYKEIIPKVTLTLNFVIIIAVGVYESLLLITWNTRLVIRCLWIIQVKNFLL